MSDKWNEFFEKQALEDLQATLPPNPHLGDVSDDEAEQAGENAEKKINESDEGNNGTEDKSEQKGTENHEGSEPEETGNKETV